ncbi:hypothetical protein ACVXHA_22375 [Escherichia coli]
MTRNAVSASGNRHCYDEALPLAGNCRTGGGYPGDGLGMIGDNMMVTADNRSLWLVIGLITLAVMVFAGGHFYRSAWKSLLNGAATMDTLVALGTGVAWLYSMSVNLWPQWLPDGSATSLLRSQRDDYRSDQSRPYAGSTRTSAFF